jgi:hypothetical protein
MLIVVVFLAPLGPRKPKISPRRTLKLGLSTAVCCRQVFFRFFFCFLTGFFLPPTWGESWVTTLSILIDPAAGVQQVDASEPGGALHKKASGYFRQPDCYGRRCWDFPSSLLSSSNS